MRLHKIAIILIINIIVINFGLYAGSPGTSSGLLMIENIAARPASLGGAYGAAGEDVNSIRYNPAGLSNITQYEFQFSHYASFMDINYESLMLGIPIKKNISIGFSVDFVNYGDFIGRIDEFAEPTTFTADDSLITFSYSQKLPSKKINLGVNLKYLNSEIENEKANAFAFDAGALFLLNKNIVLGLAIQNFGSKIKYISEEEDLPLNIKFSGKYKPITFVLPPVFYFDFNVPKGQPANFNLGIEFWLSEALAIRSGYRDKVDEGQYVAGFGIRSTMFELDYAYMFANDLDSTHRISAIFRFGGIKSENPYVKDKKHLKDYFTPNADEKNKKQKYREFKFNNNNLSEKIILFPPMRTIK